jgi:hypothetical protein
MDILSDNFQLWSLSGESCPEGTIPIRRTKKEDILRASSINTFGRKLNQVRVDTTKYKHVVCNHRTHIFLFLDIFCSLIFSFFFIFMQIIIFLEGYINANIYI